MQHSGALLKNDVHWNTQRSEPGQILLQHGRKLASFLHEPAYARIVTITLKPENLAGELVDGRTHARKVYPVTVGARVPGESASILEERELSGIGLPVCV
jgi:hypothetical protein